MRTTLILFLILFSSFSSIAQPGEQKAQATFTQFSLEDITAMIENIKLEDFSTQAHRWGFAYMCNDREKLQKFADILHTNEKRELSIRESSRGGFICSIEDMKIFTAQSLYDRINYLNELAETCGVGQVRSFGLMKEE